MNISVTAMPGVFMLVGRTDYFLRGKEGRSIELPGKPTMVIRVKRRCYESGSPLFSMELLGTLGAGCR